MYTLLLLEVLPWLHPERNVLMLPHPQTCPPKVYLHVYNDPLVTLMSDLRKSLTWWQERKATLAHATDATRETERTTFHVEKRWIEAIRRQADLDQLTITQVVNEAFRRFLSAHSSRHLWPLARRSDHPRADQTPEGCGLLVGEPLDKLVQCRTGCGRASRMGLRKGGLVVPDGLSMARLCTKSR